MVNLETETLYKYTFVVKTDNDFDITVEPLDFFIKSKEYEYTYGDTSPTCIKHYVKRVQTLDLTNISGVFRISDLELDALYNFNNDFGQLTMYSTSEDKIDLFEELIRRVFKYNINMYEPIVDKYKKALGWLAIHNCQTEME